jgi:hypothetical protein
MYYDKHKCNLLEIHSKNSSPDFFNFQEKTHRPVIGPRTEHIAVGQTKKATLDWSPPLKSMVYKRE